VSIFFALFVEEQKLTSCRSQVCQSVKHTETLQTAEQCNLQATSTASALCKLSVSLLDRLAFLRSAIVAEQLKSREFIKALARHIILPQKTALLASWYPLVFLCLTI
jgi:hypothetical protein